MLVKVFFMLFFTDQLQKFKSRHFSWAVWFELQKRVSPCASTIDLLCFVDYLLFLTLIRGFRELKFHSDDFIIV